MTALSAEAAAGLRRFLAVLLIVKLAYLAVEIAFNVRLVDVLGGGADLRDLHGIEFYGRLLAGIAAMLLLWRVLRWDGARPLRSAARFAALGCVAVFALFFGQKALVNLVVDRSDAQARHSAFLLNLLPVALRSSGTLEGFPPLEEIRAEGFERSYLALIGVSAWLSPGVKRGIEAQADAIVQRWIFENAFPPPKGAQDAVAGFDALRERMDEAFARYERYSEAAARIAPAVDDAWAQLYQALVDRYVLLVGDYVKRTSPEELNPLAAKLRAYCQLMAVASTSPTQRARAQAEFDDVAFREFGEAATPAVVCAAPVTEAAMRERVAVLIARDLQGGQGVNPRAASGAPIEFDAFRDHPAVRAEARERLAAQGLVMPADWVLSDRARFAAAVEALGREQLQREAGAAIEKELGGPIPPGLSRWAFYAHPLVAPRVRQAAAQAMSKAFAGADIALESSPDPGWTRAEFEYWLYDQVVRRTGGRWRATCVGPPASYGPGELRAGLGRDAVRALATPALALAFGLFFIVFNLVSVVFICAALVWPRAERTLRLATFVAALGVATALGAPRIGLAAFEGFEPIHAESMRENPALAVAIGWIARVQPAAHRLLRPPVEALLGERGFRMSDGAYDRLARLDRIVLGRLPGGEDLGPRPAGGARAFDDDCRSVATRRIDRRSPEPDQR